MLDPDFTKSISPIICVMIVTYRSDATIERCLRSLEKQTFQEFEVIVVDNGLTPALDTLVYDSRLNVRIIHASDNLGFAAGNNLAAKQASPGVKWLAMLNPDAFARKDWLENFMKAQIKYPKVVMFGSLQLEDTREGFCDGMGDSYHVFGLAWRRGHGRLLPVRIEDRETFSPCAAASFYRLDAFRALVGLMKIISVILRMLT